ncbi:MAG: PhoH family protein [Robiginitomaculum sp.]|nr:PhoH family protein [Robiginitomaculum sp.]
MKLGQIETPIVEFPDLTAFRMVCGINHSNLTYIEQKLNVILHAPGGKMLFEGAQTQVDKARQIIRRLYQRALAGETIGEPQVRSELSFTANDEAEPTLEHLQFGAGRRSVSARNPAQQIYLRMLMDQKNDLVFGIGPAGTGKTFLAIAYGASLLLAKRIERLIVARPALEAGERLGFLPGDLAEKVDPYMIPIWDALHQTMGQQMLDRLREQGKIEIAPLAFMRGRTLSDALVVLDEAQNASIAQMQMVLTRLGEGGRMVVTGDPGQSDLPRAQRSGLAHAVQILDGIKGIGVHQFTANDVVRHPLVARIVRAYEADQKHETQ